MQTTGEAVIEANWLERLGWILAASVASGFGAWLWASFKKVDKATHREEMERLEKAIDHRFDEFEYRVVEPIRKRNSQFEQKFDAMNEKLDKITESLAVIRTKLEVSGK